MSIGPAPAIVVTGPARLNLFGPGDSVDVVVEVPEASAVDVAVKYGSAHVSGPVGTTRLAVAYGEVTVESATRLEVSGGHGDIRVNRVDGNAEVTFKSGTARLDRIEGDLRIKGIGRLCSGRLRRWGRRHRDLERRG